MRSPANSSYAYGMIWDLPSEEMVAYTSEVIRPSFGRRPSPPAGGGIGNPARTRTIMMLRTLTLFLSAASLILAGDAVNQLSDDEKLAGWQLLFDGETTTGWEGFNDTPFPSQSWAIENGTIRTLADRRGGDLVSVSQFENFELVFDWRLVSGGNSGVKYLVQKAWAGPGYRPHNSFYSMILPLLRPPLD